MEVTETYSEKSHLKQNLNLVTAKIDYFEKSVIITNNLPIEPSTLEKSDSNDGDIVMDKKATSEESPLERNIVSSEEDCLEESHPTADTLLRKTSTLVKFDFAERNLGVDEYIGADTAYLGTISS